MKSNQNIVSLVRKRVIYIYPYYENPKKLIFTSFKKKTYNFSSHFHNNLEIAFCFSGAQLVRIGETVYKIKKGEAVIIFPNTVHEYIECNDSLDEQTEVLAIILNNKLIAEGVPEIFTKHPENPHIKSELISEDAANAFKKILTAQSNISLIGWTYVALSELLKVVPLMSLETNLELAPKLVAYIDNNFKEDLSINRLARVFGYSSSYIAHIFCDQLKIPFRTYLASVRSEYAASLIRKTQKNLTEIAYESGFLSLNTFCRSFKKHFSMTPSQYKKTIT